MTSTPSRPTPVRTPSASAAGHLPAGAHDDGGAPLAYFVFDLLHLDGWDLRETPLEARKEVLRFSDHVRGRGPDFFEAARAQGLEVHWNARASHLEQPDQVIFDLDPDEALPFSRVAAAARRVRALLAERGLESFVKTAGGKGLHVCVPLAPEHGWEALEEFSRKVFVDYLRNVRGANAVGPYSTRAREGAPVAVPVDWDELDRLSSATDFTVAEVPLRVLGFAAARPADPWARYLACRQRIPESLTRDLAGTA